MLIGFRVNVKGSNLSGTVIDETKNTLLLETGSSQKRVIKDNNRFILDMDGKKIKIKGEEINLRPWEYAIY